MIDIKVGSTETLLVDVDDALNNLTNLATAIPRFDVYASDGTQKINSGVPTIDPLRPLTAQCLVNTTGWMPGRYSLYMRFTFNADVPRLGPLEFMVNP
jgi:hypothetical protein